MMHVIRISDVEIISMLMPSSASASNIRAAYPGAFWIPAPTIDTLATRPSVVISWNRGRG